MRLTKSSTPNRWRRISGLEALRFVLTENELTGDDLAKLLKVERSVAYRILKGSRNLTADHIRTLARRFSFVSQLRRREPTRPLAGARP